MKEVKKVFYVYEWFNIETDEVFYVGKGKNNRYKNIKQRNKYFINYYNKYKCNVRKVKENLLEDEAFDLEVKLIADYKEKGMCKCNITKGGEGATYDEGTWNYLFRSLQYSHDVRNGTARMSNEEDYDSDNLKTKTLNELQKMYDDYNDFKNSQRANSYLEDICNIRIEEPLTRLELEMQSSEIKMLTDMFAKYIAKENKKYKDYKKIKREVHFYTTEIDWDAFLDEIMDYGGREYLVELTKACHYSFRALCGFSNMPNSEMCYMLNSFHMKEDGFWHIRLQDRDTFKHHRVKINIKDILMGILMAKKNFSLYKVLHNEIVFAQIYK